MNIQLLKAFFVITVLLFPLGELARFSFEYNVAITANDLLVGIIVLFWFVNNQLKNIQQFAITKSIGIFIAVCLLSLVINSNKYLINELFIAFLYLLRWSAYASLYFVVKELKPSFKNKIIPLMVIVGGVTVFGGYLQYFFYPNLRNLYYAGWDEHLYRMFSSFLDPNFAGAFFVLLFFLISGIFFENVKRKALFTFFLGIESVLTLVAVFLTYSRSAYIMLFVGVVVFLIIKKNLRLLLAFFVFFILVLGLLSKSLQSEGTNLFRTASGQARLVSAQNAVAIFNDHPIFGVGFNAYRYTQYRYGFISKQEIENHAGAGTDNSFLFVLATTGIIGLTAYLYIWYSVIKNIILSKKISRYSSTPLRFARNDIINVVFVSSIIGLFVNALFINSLFYPFIMEWMWILLGLRENKKL